MDLTPTLLWIHLNSQFVNYFFTEAMERRLTCHRSDSAWGFPLCLETYASSAPMAFVSKHKDPVNTKVYHYQHMYEWYGLENWKYYVWWLKEDVEQADPLCFFCGLIIALLQICGSIFKDTNLVSVMQLKPRAS